MVVRTYMCRPSIPRFGEGCINGCATSLSLFPFSLLFGFFLDQSIQKNVLLSKSVLVHILDCVLVG